MTSHTDSCSFSCSMEIVWYCLHISFGDFFGEGAVPPNLVCSFGIPDGFPSKY